VFIPTANGRARRLGSLDVRGSGLPDSCVMVLVLEPQLRSRTSTRHSRASPRRNARQAVVKGKRSDVFRGAPRKSVRRRPGGLISEDHPCRRALSEYGIGAGIVDRRGLMYRSTMSAAECHVEMNDDRGQKGHARPKPGTRQAAACPQGSPSYGYRRIQYRAGLLRSTIRYRGCATWMN